MSSSRCGGCSALRGGTDNTSAAVVVVSPLVESHRFAGGEVGGHQRERHGRMLARCRDTAAGRCDRADRRGTTSAGRPTLAPSDRDARASGRGGGCHARCQPCGRGRPARRSTRTVPRSPTRPTRPPDMSRAHPHLATRTRADEEVQQSRPESRAQYDSSVRQLGAVLVGLCATNETSNQVQRSFFELGRKLSCPLFDVAAIRRTWTPLAID